MKMAQWATGLIVTGVVAGSVLAAESGYLVKVIGYDHKAELETMSEVDFKALEKSIKLEQKYFPKAVELAGKDWRADELNKKVTFPGSRLTPRTIMMAQEYPSLEKAEAQLNRLQDQEAKKLEKQTEAEKKNPQLKKGKSKTVDSKEAEVMQASDLVKSKLVDLIAKAGGDTNALASEVKAEVKGEAKAEAKAKPDAKAEKVEKANKKADAKEAAHKAL